MRTLAAAKTDTKAKIAKWTSTNVSHRLVRTSLLARRARTFMRAHALQAIEVRIVPSILTSAARFLARTEQRAKKV